MQHKHTEDHLLEMYGLSHWFIEADEYSILYLLSNWIQFLKPKSIRLAALYYQTNSQFRSKRHHRIIQPIISNLDGHWFYFRVSCRCNCRYRSETHEGHRLVLFTLFLYKQPSLCHSDYLQLDQWNYFCVSISFCPEIRKSKSGICHGSKYHLLSYSPACLYTSHCSDVYRGPI